MTVLRIAGRTTAVAIAVGLAIMLVWLGIADASGPVCEYGSGPCGPTVPPPITATSVPETTTTTEGGGLPFTGGDQWQMALLGAGLALGGYALVWWMRERRYR